MPDRSGLHGASHLQPYLSADRPVHVTDPRRAVQTGHAIPMQEFTADLKHMMRGVWRDAELVDPNTHNNKLATYHSWFAIPFSSIERMPIYVPRYLHLDLSKHAM